MGIPEDSIDDVFLPCGPLRLDLLSPAAQAALEQALRITRETRWDSLRSPHLFMGILAVPDDSVCDWGTRLRADLARLLDQFRELFQQDESRDEPILRLHREFVSDNVLCVMRNAYRRTREYGRDRITPMDVLISVLGADNSLVAECFERIGIPATTLTHLAFLAERDCGYDSPDRDDPVV